MGNKKPVVGWFKNALTLGFGVAAGCVVWVFSKKLTGHLEPWDSPFIYFAYLLLTSFCVSFLGWKKFSLFLVGLWLGQVVYMDSIYLPKVSGPVILPPWFSVLFHGLVPCMFGAVAGIICSKIIKTRNGQKKGDAAH